MCQPPEAHPRLFEPKNLKCSYRDQLRPLRYQQPISAPEPNKLTRWPMAPLIWNSGPAHMTALAFDFEARAENFGPLALVRR